MFQRKLYSFIGMFLYEILLIGLRRPVAGILGTHSALCKINQNQNKICLSESSFQYETNKKRQLQNSFACCSNLRLLF